MNIIENTLSDSLQEISRWLMKHESFEIRNVSPSNMNSYISILEKQIETEGLSCRIYTKGRSAAIGAGLVSFGAGLGVAVGIAAHNLATYNPDYEIAKDFINNKIFVDYKK